MQLESAILTETLATALPLGAAVALVHYRTRPRRGLWVLLAMGLAVGVVPLVRPLCIFVPFLFALPGGFTVGLTSRRFWLYLLPAILPAVAWCTYMGVTISAVTQAVVAYGVPSGSVCPLSPTSQSSR